MGDTVRLRGSAEGAAKSMKVCHSNKVILGQFRILVAEHTGSWNLSVYFVKFLVAIFYEFLKVTFKRNIKKSSNMANIRQKKRKKNLVYLVFNPILSADSKHARKSDFVYPFRYYFTSYLLSVQEKLLLIPTYNCLIKLTIGTYIKLLQLEIK